MNRIVGSICALVLVTSCGPGIVNGQEHRWPIAPTDKDHPLGATLGQFQEVHGKVYQHTGIDILETSCSPGDTACIASLQLSCGDAAEPCVIATVGGFVWTNMFGANDPGPGEGEALHIEATHADAPDIIAANVKRTYRYYHLKHESYFAAFVDSYKRNASVLSGTPIARINPWTCDYKHLHYDVFEPDSAGSFQYLNPLSAIAIDSRRDVQAPEFVFGIKLAKRNSSGWTAFSSAGDACTVVKDKVDIVVQLRDRDDAGSNLPGAQNVGIYNLRWRACPESTPDCAWNDTQRYDAMPIGWEIHDNDDTKAQFSTTSPWVSNHDQCPTTENKTFMVATSIPAAGSWDTKKDGRYPNGRYLVSVQASDIAGNVSVKIIQACVANR